MNTNLERHDDGFTLVELLVVTTLIGVIAGVAVPNLLSGRSTANEAAVLGSLRAIVTAQFQFQSGGELDRNGDGSFEYGTLGELGAVDGLRDGSAPLERHLLSRTIATVDANGWAEHHGYHICLYMANATGTGIAATAANAGAIDDDRARDYWTCLAWPIRKGATGNRVFFVNQQGQMLQCTESAYSGATSVPPAGAALLGVPPAGIESHTFANGNAGADGNRWVVVN